MFGCLGGEFGNITLYLYYILPKNMKNSHSLSAVLSPISKMPYQGNRLFPTGH